MPQSSTKEFSHRLQQAVDGHPLAPENTFGRQSWLREKLEREGKLKVSPNTLHKWFNGTARPREDNIRTLARVLGVDDVWLSLGRRPVMDDATVRSQAAQATGAALLLAGLFETRGNRVAFPEAKDEGVSLFIDIGTGRRAITVVTPQVKGDTISFVVPEPVRDNCIVSVQTRKAPEPCPASACVDILDLTGCERQNFGGFSVIQGELRKDGRIQVPGQRQLVAPLGDLSDLAMA